LDEAALVLATARAFEAWSPIIEGVVLPGDQEHQMAVENKPSRYEESTAVGTGGGCGSAIDEHVRRVIDSGDAEALRTALLAEATERRRAECLANIQTEITKYTLDLLVRVPNLEAFFHALLKTLAEEGESDAAGVWLINDEKQVCDFWMAHLFGQVFSAEDLGETYFPRLAMADHLFAHKPGWEQTIEYRSDDPRLPQMVREFNSARGLFTTVAAPLLLGGNNLGWITLCVIESPEAADSSWWRIALVEAIARHAALALHKSRLFEQKRAEERRKAILEERNRIARDIHDNLAQGFGAILMQLQAAQRAGAALPPAVERSIETAIELARTHMVEARRSVGALRPNVSGSENVATALRRVAELARKTSDIPIDVHVDELPRFGDGVEREMIGIAQEALTNAVRHARARRITIRAASVDSLGLRLSIADDGRGIPRERQSSGFGMTSMQERAERIGASLTIVTAPRSGTEVVLAWEPSSLPTQIHAFN
jgi:signal transduction histidine kinase